MIDATFFRRLRSKPAFSRLLFPGLVCLLFATANAYAALDYGDAPASYGDASHTIVNGLHLGQTPPDAEADSQHSFNAFGDGDVQIDGAGTWYLSGDEDGAPRQPVSDYIPLFPILKLTAMSYSVTFQVTNNQGGNNASDATLFGWIDFDGNGVFDTDEAASAPVIDGSNNASVTLSWNVPVDIKLGSTFIRLRLTSDAMVTTNTPTGSAANGEVEDFVLAVALDIPPDSNDVTVTAGEAPLACQSVVFADDFDDVAVNSSVFLAPNRGAGGGSVSTLRDWVVAGGGADSYARMYDASAFGMGSAVYLGNGAVRRISPAIGSGFSFDSNGRVTNIIDAIELRDTADDSTPGSTLMGVGTAAHWGPEPVTLSRSFATQAGKSYRLYFKAVPEDGSFESGAMRVDVPGGGVHFKIPGSDEDTIHYAIEFTANSTTSTLTFVNYGHVNARGGIGWCDPVSEYANNPWCTVGGGDVNGNELIIDEVMVAESDCGTGSISGVVYTDSNSNNSYDSATETGINAMAVTLFDDNGTAADLTDDVQVSTTSSNASGEYSFSNIDASKTYRLAVDATDPDLPGQLSLGTTNPLTGIAVTAGNDTGNQNFGFDPFIYSCPASGTPKIENGFAAAVTLDQGVAYEQYALGALTAAGSLPSSLNASLIASGDVLTLDLGEFVPEAAILQLSLARHSSQGRVEVAVSPFNNNYSVLGTFGDAGTLGAGTVQELEHVGVSVPAGGARFIRFTNVTASTWVDGVSYNAVCTGADDVAEISGTVYRDNNANDVYDSASEPGLSAITVSLFDEADDSLVMGTATDGNGDYRFPGLPADKVYRVEVDESDSSLPFAASVGTTNPLTGIAVVAGSTTANQNVGFDIPPVIPPAPTGDPGTCWAIDDDTATIYKFLPDVSSPQPPTLIPTSRSNSGEGLAWRPSTNELFMWDGTTTYVLKADDGTDVRSFTADLAPGTDVEGATFYVNPATLEEELWLTVEDYVSGVQRNDRYLVRIDPQTGANITAIGPLSGGYIDPGVDYGKDTGGLAIDPNSRQFWITNDGLERGLYALDPATGIVNYGTLFNPSQVDGEGLAFANDGYLYTESDEGPSTDRYIWRVDAATGNITRAAGPFPGSGDVEGLTCDGGAVHFMAPATISGTVYTDNNGNNSYDSAFESGLGSITVSLLNDANGAVIATTSTAANGAYTFSDLDTTITYRLEVDEDDTDLSAGLTIGTINPLTGITVAAGETTANQDFGFDPAQSTFTCDASIYIGSSTSESIPAQFYSVNTTTSPFTLDAIGDTAHGHSYNAMGYREQDDYIYAIKQASSNLLRIGADGSVVDLGAVSGLPVPANIFQTYDAGDVFPDGYLYIHEVTTHPELYKIDVTTTPPSLVETINLSQAIWLSDFAYNKIDNKVYGIGDQGEKFMIDPTTWAVSTVGTNTSPASYGAAYTDNLGNVYIYKNNPGVFYKVDFGLNGTGTGNMNELSPALNVSFNDGASCRGEPPVVEDVLEGKVWFDANSDGIQNDGADSYIEGATVELLDPATSTIIAATTSNVNGEYQFFESDGLQSATAYRLRIAKLDNEQPFNDWAITNIRVGTDATLDSDAILVGNYWQITLTTPVSGATSNQDFGFTNSSTEGCLADGSSGVSDESVANAHPNTYDFLFDGQQVTGFCAEKSDADPAAGDNYTAHNTDRQSLTNVQRSNIARSYSAMTDPDIIFQIASAFGNGNNQLRLDDLMQYITWYYTDWSESLVSLDSQVDSNGNYTTGQQTAMKILARTVLDRVNGVNGEAQYPEQDIFWLWNMTDASRQDIVVPALYAQNSSCSVPGSISGTVYIDNNANDIYDSGSESGIDAITVSLLNNADNAVLGSTSTATDGSYSFTSLDSDLIYRLLVDDEDADLAEGMVVGTTNPLGNISVAGGSAVVNQNFGFDDPLDGCSLIVVTTADSDSVDNDSGSLRDAIECANATPGPNTITFNIPTSDPGHAAGVWTISPDSQLPTVTDAGTTIDASTQPGTACGDLWALSPGRTLKVQLDGATVSATGYTRGLAIQGDNFALRGMAVTNFLPGVGIYTQPEANNSRFTCNHIGVAADGMTAGSNSNGLDLRGSTTYLGDVGIGDGNIISGNSLDGGVGAAFNNADTSYVYNNFFGAGLDGATAVPNRLALWNISSANMQIGGPSAGQRNLFSGNSSTGITFQGPNTDNSFVQGNYIGTAKSGLTALANQTGINFGDFSTRITIGGSGSGEGNVISGNSLSGIASGSDVGEDANHNFILSNIIGLDKDAVNPLPNQDGIALYEVDDFVIQENTIARNSRLGILLQNGADNVVISHNSIFSNALQGIDLQSHNASVATDTGVTLNDTNDLDDGANGLLNFPVLSKIELSDGDMIIQGCAPAGSVVEIFESDVSAGGSATPGDNQFGLSRDYGEGEIYLLSAVEGSVADLDNSGCAIPGGDGNDHSSMNAFFFVVPVPADVELHDVITATATLPTQGTSEFGPMVSVTDKPPTIGGGSCPADGGTDILFIVDNSGSISESEFSDFSQSIQDVGSSFLTDNPANRIAIAHFGGPSESLANGGQHVYIERDFSSGPMLAPVRQFGQGGAYNSAWTADHLAGAVQQMRYALDGNAATTSGLIISPLREMSRNSAIPLQIVLMTDAARYLDGTPGDISMLIDPVGSGAEPNDGSDFTIYNELKTENINFAVVSFNVSADASAAAGAIASVGGAYSGAVEANTADPEGSQVVPRRYVPVTTGFVLALDQVSQMVDSVAICGNNISGAIFEDTIYGGGNGRAFGDFGTIGLPGASIEVYDDSGEYIAAVNSSVEGAYRLPNLPNGDYFVRVVNGTVSSSRVGSDGSEVPVMTYRSNGITEVANEIGGRYPELEDAPANADASTLNTTTFMFSAGGLETLPAQSLQPITLNGGSAKNVNFGFNFNTVVNKRASGQGSLQQFVLNNNQLESNGIQQQLPSLVTPDYFTGDSVAVFMIPTSQLVNDKAVIDTITELRIERPGIAIDGRVQLANMGSGRIVLRGDGMSLANGVYVGEEADNATLRDLDIENFGGSGAVIFGTGSTNDQGAVLERLTITGNGQYGVLIQNDAANSKIIANSIQNNTWAGISSEAARNNTFSQNNVYANGGLGIDLGADGVTPNSNTDDWLNYPEVLAGSTISSNGSQVVTYDFDLDVPGNPHGYRVEFFSNTELDPSNHGEGEIYLGYVDITSFGTGLQNFKGVMNANQTVPTAAKISVTLTEKMGSNSLGATSEFSGVRDGNAAVCTDLLSDPDAPLETVTVDENSGPITLLEAKDENGDPITYVISGDADGSQFIIKSVPGALIDCFIIEFIGDDVIGTKDLAADSTIRVAPLPGNYEAPTDSNGDNTYDLIITATDSNGNTVTKPVSVVVQDVNEKPRITSSATVSYDEKQVGVVVDLEAYDPDEGDAEGSGLIYSIGGGADAGRFTVDPYTGEVNFRVAPDFNHPADKDADNVYELTVRVADDQGYASTKSLLISVTGEPDTSVVGLRVRAILQGAYIAETGLMHDTLRTEGLLPLTQPYTSELFNYNGDEQIGEGLLAMEGENAVVDWVLLELWDANDPSRVVAGKAALLQRDGDVVDAATGVVELSLPIAAGQYYLSLRHRNHLGVVTALPLTLNNDASVNLIDFSQPTTALRGEHARLQVAANDDSGDIALLWSGDVNQDQRLVVSGQGSDLNPILNAVLLAPENSAYNSSYQVIGYHATDLNMDGVALFMGPGNDANVVLGNVLLHPANASFLGNFVAEGGM